MDRKRGQTLAADRTRAARLLCAWLGRIAVLAGLLGASLAFAEPRMSVVAGAGGVPLLVAEEGNRDAPGILFLHGFAQSHLSFGRQFDSDLARRYHLVAFDLRGHGGSGKPWDETAYADARVWADDVAAVIKATGLRRPVIVGWSYGGFVAVDYLRIHGSRNVAGLSLVGSLGGLTAAPAMSAGDSPRARQMRARSDRQRGVNLAANIAANQETAAGYVTPNMTSAERDTLAATEMMMPAYARRAMKARNLDNRDMVPKLDLPILLTRGSTDVAMPSADTNLLLERLPKARLSDYVGAGHLAFVEQPDRFNRELAAFAAAAKAR